MDTSTEPREPFVTTYLYERRAALLAHWAAFREFQLRQFYFIVLLGIGFAILFVACHLFRNSKGPYRFEIFIPLSLFPLACMVTGVAIDVIIMFRRARRDAAIGSRVTVTVNAEHIELQTQMFECTNSTRYTWPDVQRVIETKKGFRILIKPKTTLFIPGKAFTSRDDVRAFESFIPSTIDRVVSARGIPLTIPPAT